MSGSLWQTIVTREAEALVRELGIDALPVCPFSIAQVLDIEVQPLPNNTRPGISGMLLHHNGNFGILYSTYMDNKGFERFTISHEIGHYWLPGHPESVFNDGVHTSYAGFNSTNRFELEADHFAAGLLMPGFLFDPAMDEAGIGLDAIEILHAKCVTSLTATAIRYAQHTSDSAAIVVSTGHALDYCFMSDSLREIRGLDWLRKGSGLPRKSVTYRFNCDISNVTNSERMNGNSSLQDWFGGQLKLELSEEVVGLGSYGRTLTVLTANNLPDAEEIEEEEELIDSWEPKFRR